MKISDGGTGKIIVPMAGRTGLALSGPLYVYDYITVHERLTLLFWKNALTFSFASQTVNI